MKTFTGSCHCQQVQFEFKCDSLDAGVMCNCSICIRKNAIMSKQTFKPKDFKITKGQNNLNKYQFGDHDVNHYFCKTCGIYPFHDINIEPYDFRVNLGCVDDVSSRDLDTFMFDGKNEL